MKRTATALVCAVVLVAMGSFVYFQVSAQHHKTVKTALTQNERAVNNATVTFGAWMTDVPIDRFPANNANTQFPRARNHHELIPTIATVRAGGTVNFIIGGFHVVAIYDGNTLPSQIDRTNTVLPANAPAPPIINDPVGRIYRGLDPTVLPLNAQQDRVEAVHFSRPGLYLVICAVLPHFNEGMYGYVRVVGRDDEDFPNTLEKME